MAGALVRVRGAVCVSASALARARSPAPPAEGVTDLRELLERERRVFRERTPGSEALFRRAQRTLPGGVASSFQRREPWPVYVSRGEGARVWDVDGNEYIDFHNGFSAMVQGHAHPAIGAAVERRLALGTHFGAPTEEVVAVSEELARRFGLPRLALHELGDRVDHGRDPHRPRVHRPRRTSRRSSAPTTATTTR